MRRHHLLPSLGCHVAGLALLVAGVTAPVAALAIDSQLDAGMPLVLKDGRIANVTVHTIPFETGEDDLPPQAATALRRLVEPMATDCFLTAQAIGHVEPGVTRDGDTLSAHRLARARADNIQAMLAGLGMPQAAVASVWDWQFLEEKSQVTLWVFSLNTGDDCAGVPLEPVQAELAPTPSEQVRPVRQASAEEPVEAPVTPPSELRVSDAVAAPARPATVQSRTTAAAAGAQPAPPVVTVEPTVEPAVTQPAPSPDTAVAAATSAPPTAPAAAASPPDDPLATAAVAPVEPPAPAATEAPAAATTQPAEAEPAATRPTDVASVAPSAVAAAGDSTVAALVIPFDVNSSFFPSGAGRELRGFLEGLPAAGPVEIELAGAVGTGSVRGASGEEAERYNAWMAERRIERVAEWLEANAGDRQLTLKPRLVEDDPSREVRLRAVPTP